MVFDTESVLSLDAGDYIAEAEEAADATSSLGDETDETSGVLDQFGDIAAGVGLAAVGAGAQAALDGTQPLREELGRSAEIMGKNSEETEELAASLSDATFPIEDATGTIASLASQGIDTAEDMEKVAESADLIADATGTSAESVADNLGPAIVALGDDLEDMDEMADAFALAVNNSTLETEDLASVIERSSEDLDEMGLAADDAAGLISEYANETGKSGRRASRDFSRAVQEADGDLDELIETTGLSENVLEDWSEEVEASEGAAEDQAAAANESLSVMDDMRAVVDDLRLRFSGLLQPISAAAPAMMGLGTAIAGLSAAGVTAGGVVGTLGAALTVLTGPIGIAIGLVAALTAAWTTDFMGIRTSTLETFEGIREATAPFVELLREQLGELAAFVLDIWRDHFEPLREEFLETFGFLRDTVIDPFLSAFRTGVETTLGVLGSLWSDHGDSVMSVVSFFTSIIAQTIDTTMSTLTGLISAGLSLARGDFEGFATGIMSVMGGIRDHVLSVGQQIFDGLVSVFGRIGEAVSGTVSEAFNAVVPSSLELPSTTVGGQSISTTIAGEEIGATLPERTVGGGSLNLPQLNTGGTIERGGVAEVHEDEHVINPARADKGNPTLGPSVDDIERGVRAADRTDEVLRQFRRLIRAVEESREIDVEVRDGAGVVR